MDRRKLYGNVGLPDRLKIKGLNSGDALRPVQHATHGIHVRQLLAMTWRSQGLIGVTGDDVIARSTKVPSAWAEQVENVIAQEFRVAPCGFLVQPSVRLEPHQLAIRQRALVIDLADTKLRRPVMDGCARLQYEMTAQDLVDISAVAQHEIHRVLQVVSGFRGKADDKEDMVANAGL